MANDPKTILHKTYEGSWYKEVSLIFKSVNKISVIFVFPVTGIGGKERGNLQIDTRVDPLKPIRHKTVSSSIHSLLAFIVYTRKQQKPFGVELQ
jgi:hypothetical protein